MCVITMVNDGGLRAVLDTSDLISRELLALSRSKAQRFSPQDEEVQNLAKKAADILDVNDDSVRSGIKRHASRTLSELSVDSAAGHSKKMNLSLHTSEELKKAVSPLVEKMKKLDAAALLSLNPSNSPDGATLDNGLTVPPIHDRISPSYADDGSNIVRYLHVKEVPNRYSAGIFIFPPNAEIPLHDHPDMVVLSRVLYGELRVQSYDVLPAAGAKTAKVTPDADETKKQIEEAPKQSVFRSPITALKNFVSVRSGYRGEKEDTQLETDSDSSCQNAGPTVLQAKENLSPMGAEKIQGAKEDDPVNVLSAPHVTCLYPDEGNCHAFVAGPHGAAVLDVSFISICKLRPLLFYRSSLMIHPHQNTGVVSTL